MIFTREERDLARDLFIRIKRATTRGTDLGVTRASYGDGETRVRDIIAEVACDAGLASRSDRAGNLYIANGGAWPSKAIVVGSHMDSVPNGGNYDGLAGVVAGLLIVLKAKRRGSTLPIVAMGLRGEESAWFGVPYLGAKALFGRLPQTVLFRKRRGSDFTLAHYMAASGCLTANILAIESGVRILSEDMISEFWELHIEQGPILDESSTPVGLVTGIRGNVRAPRAFVIGEPGHSGTTPHKMRKDAVVRFADLISELEDRRGHLTTALPIDLMVTCGIVSTDESVHSMTTIAGRVDFSLDIRSMNDADAKDFLEYAKRYAGDYVEWGDIVTTPSAWLDKSLLRRSTEAANKLGVTTSTLPSGAGHDAAVFQQNGVPSGMVFVRNQHGSHNPHEEMNIDDFMQGVEVLWQAISG